MKHQFNAALMIFISFAVTVLIGTFLLWLPISHCGGYVSLVDAFFMSTSAVCVTGLAVFDIGTQLTLFGQWVILVLIQVGGLGIMTISVFLMMLFQQQISLASFHSVNFEPQNKTVQNFLHILSFVFIITILIESIGAILLFYRFHELYPFSKAAFFSIFHSVSAFCNAGFSLYEDSLSQFKNDAYLLCVFMGLIILGGLGFMLINELWNWIKNKLFYKKSVRLSLHARICLIGTFVLIVSGALIFWGLETPNLLKGIGFKEQILNATFLSVTCRTAGFNTLPTSYLTNATLFYMIWLMFIGACPGSTGGGIKVPTFVVLIALIKNQMVGKSASLFQRKIPIKTVARSLAVFTAGFILVNFFAFSFQISEHIGASHLTTQGSFLDLLLEIVSAFATVGLSTGVTNALTSTGKLLIVFLMFVGRIGPLTLGAIFFKKRGTVNYEYIEEDIAIG